MGICLLQRSLSIILFSHKSVSFQESLVRLMRTNGCKLDNPYVIFIVVPCILMTLRFLSPTNAPLYYTYKMLKCTVKISHECSYMFRSTWTIIREPMPNLAKVTILWRQSVKIRRYMFSNANVNVEIVSKNTSLYVQQC